MRHRIALPAFGLAFVLCVAGFSARRARAVDAVGNSRPPENTSRTQVPAPAVGAMLSESYGKLPLSFEPNQGQTDKRVKFVSRGRGYSLFLTPTEAVLALHNTNGRPASPARVNQLGGRKD